MTNGENLKNIYPDLEIIREIEDVYVIMLETHNVCSPKLEVFKSWWNAEYKEPITCKDCKHIAPNDVGDYYCDVSGAYYDPDYHCEYAEYKEPSSSENPISSTTKNDLGVDAVSRKAVLEIYDEWFDTCNIADKKESPKAKINALPQVTPIRPKGHWIKTELPSRDAHECSECGGLALVDEDGNEQLTDFCPNCGSYNGGDNIGNE